MTYDRRTHTFTCPDCGHVERTEPLMCSGKDVTTITDTEGTVIVKPEYVTRVLYREDKQKGKIGFADRGRPRED